MLSGESVLRIGVDGEDDRLPALLGVADQADVGLVDRGVDVDLLLQVGGDDEHHGRLELRGHRLARIDLAVDNDAVDRRLDVR